MHQILLSTKSLNDIINGSTRADAVFLIYPLTSFYSRLSGVFFTLNTTDLSSGSSSARLFIFIVPHASDIHPSLFPIS